MTTFAQLLVLVLVLTSRGVLTLSRSDVLKTAERRDVATAHAREAGTRERRQSGGNTPQTTYHVDILVVTDHQLFLQWRNRNSNDAVQTRTKMTEYITFVLKGINRIYQTLTSSGLNINVRLSAIHISESASESYWTEANLVTDTSGTKRVNATKALQSLRGWVNSNISYRQYDHVMLFTGYDMITDDVSHFSLVTGKAYQGTLCSQDGTSLSIISDRSAFQSVLVAAHELGHSFGAVHDGDVAGCSDQQRFLMAKISYQTVNASTNPWHFSPCSQQALQDFVQTALQDSRKRACLTETQGTELTSAREAGQVYSPDDMCRQLMGPTSYYCRSTDITQSSTICTALLCYNPGNPAQCSHFVAADGTSCGNKRWCLLGSCVSSENAPIGNPGCLYGDTPYSPPDSTCAAQVAAQPWRCYDNVFREKCCQSCANSYSGNDACGWGDQLRGCLPEACGTVDRSGNIASQACCQTCACSGNSCQCQDRLAQCSTLSHPGLCYNASLAFLCCQSCNALRTGSEGCEYGDFYKSSDCRHALSIGQVDSNLARLCCKTCKVKMTATDGALVCNYQTGTAPPLRSMATLLVCLSLLLSSASTPL